MATLPSSHLPTSISISLPSLLTYLSTQQHAVHQTIRDAKVQGLTGTIVVLIDSFDLLADPSLFKCWDIRLLLELLVLAPWSLETRFVEDTSDELEVTEEEKQSLADIEDFLDAIERLVCELKEHRLRGLRNDLRRWAGPTKTLTKVLARSVGHRTQSLYGDWLRDTEFTFVWINPEIAEARNNKFDIDNILNGSADGATHYTRSSNTR